MLRASKNNFEVQFIFLPRKSFIQSEIFTEKSLRLDLIRNKPSKENSWCRIIKNSSMQRLFLDYSGDNQYNF